jgi:hypothetical protein
MRAVGEATRCKVKEKVERALTTIAQLMTGWAEKVERGRRKKTKRGISGRVPGTQGGEEGGEGMRCAQGPPGGRSLPPSPLFLSPPPFPPKGGRRPYWNLVLSRSTRCTSTTLNGPDTRALNVEEWTPLSIDSIDEFQDFEFSLFNHRLKFELCVDSGRLFHSKRMS